MLQEGAASGRGRCAKTASCERVRRPYPARSACMNHSSMLSLLYLILSLTCATASACALPPPSYLPTPGGFGPKPAASDRSLDLLRPQTDGSDGASPSQDRLAC